MLQAERGREAEQLRLQRSRSEACLRSCRCCPHLRCSPRLLVDCNQLAVDIDNEIVVVYNFIRDKASRGFCIRCLVCLLQQCVVLTLPWYLITLQSRASPLPPSPIQLPATSYPLQYKTKFPELESLVHSPLEYARVVQVGGRQGARRARTGLLCSVGVSSASTCLGPCTAPPAPLSWRMRQPVRPVQLPTHRSTPSLPLGLAIPSPRPLATRWT